MKKFIILFLICLLVPINVSASVIVMDMDTNRVLYGSNIYDEKLIASTTKIMTAMVVLNNYPDISKNITITSSVLRSFGSGIYIEVGEQISVENLLYGLMLRSGNDAAIALSEEVGGSEEGFVILMNNLAKSIGMNNTTFINSSGLENNEGIGNTSTAYDMALLMSYAMKNDIFQKITSTTKKIVKTNYKTYEWYNKNKLLTTYKYTTGGKTGYTKKAYRTLVTTASKDNKNLVIVTLNESNDFIKHKNLYEEYFKKYKLVNLIDHKTFLKSEGLYVKEDINMLLSDSEIDKVNVNVTYTNDAIDRIGYVTVSLDNKEYYRENIYLIENSSTNESLLSKIKKFFSNLFKF
jgi:D-alanyl-D-alanine carboxypeptidase